MHFTLCFSLKELTWTPRQNHKSNLISVSEKTSQVYFSSYLERFRPKLLQKHSKVFMEQEILPSLNKELQTQPKNFTLLQNITDVTFQLQFQPLMITLTID